MNQPMNNNSPILEMRELREPQILVVEDAALYQSFWRALIRKVNPRAQLICVENALQATEEFSKRNFDLIISDIFLVDSKSGIDIWNYYLSLGKKNFKFVLTSGISYEHMERLCAGVGVQPPFIQKPYRASDCAELIHGLLMRLGNNAE